MSESQGTSVKKVKAYPFDAMVSNGATSFPVRVVKLTPIGLMCDMGGQVVKVGSTCTISLELPALHLPVQATLVVVRTWDQFAVDMKVGNASQRLAELHFRQMVPAHRDNIVTFLKSIKAPTT